ncbi:anhydro-N-acetylmuramic acid kinase [Thalassotalea fusca]
MLDIGEDAKLYLGIMSGTSADGIDLALVDIQGSTPQLITFDFVAFDHSLREQIVSLYSPANNEIDRAQSLGISLAKAYADAVKQFLSKTGLPADKVCAIGNHGQTIRHRPSISKFNNERYTLQIGCNQTLSTITNIRVIGDFRTKDMVYGGQGAPLVPAFHQAMFSNQSRDCFVVNIGGIANITYLPENSDKQIKGFDTGPGNALLDEWYQLHNDGAFDPCGQWAASGKVNKHLLSQMLSDPYFKLEAPKSTGREYFNLSWLREVLSPLSVSPVDVQATLVALTAISISDAIKALSSNAVIYVAGGGVLNNTLINNIKSELSGFEFCDITSQDLDSDALEAMAFAWLAFAYDKKFYGNIPAVTGAAQKVVLGIEFKP